MAPHALLPNLARRAQTSRGWLRLLNLVLAWVIPFNRPHGIAIAALGEDYVRTRSSYRRRNHNHVRGIHACAIATIAEMSAGFLLLTKLDPGRYRLIMSHLEVEYFYQAKEEIFAESRLDATRMAAEITDPLVSQEAVTITLESRVADRTGNHIATARTTWQVKRWDRVRTRV